MREQPYDPGGSRHIRVFISSTFRDMQAERDELIKRVFPALRKLCESRGVSWSEVDLRWGVTDEQKAEGQVLAVCLAEINNCRPYFIGLLGERYGWIQQALPPELIEREPWLAGQSGRSVTELEILHASLNDPGMAGHAFFYFRDPGYLDRLPAGADIADYQPEGPEAAGRLEELKGRIRRSGLPVREGYSDPRELGQLVLRDMTGVIDGLFPPSSMPESLDREAAEQEAFATNRLGIYIGRPAYFDRLDQHADSDGPPLVLLGESGLGKSALLANWAARRRQAKPEEPVLTHFIGATPYSADWAAMLRRILGELRRRFGIDTQIPDGARELRSAFLKGLHMAAARGRAILILDGLNGLEDRDQAPDLAWLPVELPPNVRLILAALPGRPLEELRRRNWPTFRIEPLSPEERLQVIGATLGRYRKRLDPARARRIAGARPCSNALYLRALLDEIRVFGVHERLDEAIARYIAAPDPPALFDMILARYERDFERDRPALVQDSMRLLWAARRGLSEAELLDLLGSGAMLPRAAWSPLFLAAEASLSVRSGKLAFFHDYFRQAVQARYLADEARQREAHLRLADYFSPRELGTRQLEELPWQLAQAGAWDRLYALMSSLAFFSAAWEQDEFEVRAFWARIEANSDHRVAEGYRPVLAAPEQHAGRVPAVARLMRAMGRFDEAGGLWRFLIERSRRVDDRSGLARALGQQAELLMSRGILDGAMAFLKEAERICRESGDRHGLSRCLEKQAFILKARGDLDGAMALQKETEGIVRQLDDQDGRHVSLANQASIHALKGELDLALALDAEAERFFRRSGNLESLAACLGDQATIHFRRKDFDAAMGLSAEEERLFRQLGDRAGLAVCLGNQAPIRQARGDADGALALLQEAERINRELGRVEGLALCLVRQALILSGSSSRHKDALRLAEQAYSLASGNGLVSLTERIESILLSLREAPGRMSSPESSPPTGGAPLHSRLIQAAGDGDLIAIKGLLAQGADVAAGDQDGRTALMEACRGSRVEAARLLVEHGADIQAKDNEDRTVLGYASAVGCLDIMRLLLEKGARVDDRMRDGSTALMGTALLGKTDPARLLMDGGADADLQDEKGFTALMWAIAADRAGVARLLIERGASLGVKDKKGFTALERAVGQSRREVLVALLQSASLSDLASLPKEESLVEGLLALLKAGQGMARQSGDRAGLARCLGSQALVLEAWRRRDEAMALRQEEEALRRQLGDEAGLSRCLGGQAGLRIAGGLFGEAWTLLQEQERLCRQLGQKSELALCLCNQATVRLYDRHDPDGALAALREAERLYQESGRLSGLPACLDYQTKILEDRDPEAALVAYKEMERLCRLQRNLQGLSAGLANQAHFLYGLGRAREALPLAQEAHDLAVAGGAADLSKQTERILNRVRYRAQDPG